jgi:RNA polymerase sigma-70 factor (ECF subfamily)
MSDVAEALRVAMPQALARLVSATRDLPAAEDALQEAVLKALERWPTTGLPGNPAGWLVAVARNQHTDRLRHQQIARRLEPTVARLAEQAPWSARLVERPETLGWGDDLLRLVFTCCDPVLGLAERTALTLHVVCGLTRDELARAFLVQPRTMEQRLTRAKKRLAERRPAYDVPGPEVAPERLGAVLEVLHLVFNEGYWSASDEGPIRSALCALALSLTRSLEALLPGQPEVLGLLALQLLHEARLPARRDAEGRAVPLPEQDRELWSAHGIEVGTGLVRRALSQGRPGPFQIEAAIAAVHCSAASADQTDWTEIARLYELLEMWRPTAAVRVNRAFAVGQAAGPRAGLALLEPAMDGLEGLPWALLVQAVLHEDAGQLPEARDAYTRAAELAGNDDERRVIARRLGAIGEA